jgi:hypothetical protein
VHHCVLDERQQSPKFDCLQKPSFDDLAEDGEEKVEGDEVLEMALLLVGLGVDRVGGDVVRVEEER